VSGRVRRTAMTQEIVGTYMNMRSCSREALLKRMFRVKEIKPMARVSINVITKTVVNSLRYISLFPLILGLIVPRWSIVVRLPEKMPLMSPLIVRIGGKRARIQGAVLICGVMSVIIPPANRLTMLKVRATRVWAGTEL